MIAYKKPRCAKKKALKNSSPGFFVRRFAAERSSTFIRPSEEVMREVKVKLFSAASSISPPRLKLLTSLHTHIYESYVDRCNRQPRKKYNFNEEEVK